MPKFVNPLDDQLAGEAAAALGHAGRRLRRALDALHTYDAEAARSPAGANPERRSELVASAGEAFWSYVVQRELLGVLDPEYIAHQYGVPAEVWKAMGPKQTRRGRV